MVKLCYMGNERITGNGNFDIDAIRRAAGAMEVADAVRPQAIIDSSDSTLEADIAEVEIDLQNPSSNRTDEAERLLDRPDIARLKPGALTAIRSNITIAEERREQSGEISRGADMWNERRERDQKERAARADADEFADSMQNAIQRMTPEQWDEAPSRDYPGMTNAEALSAIRRINANLPYYSQLAVQRGLIREDEQADFQTYMRNEQWLLEQERVGNIGTPEYRLRKQQQDAARASNPNFESAGRSVVEFANGRDAGPLAATPTVGATGNAVGSAARANEVNALGVDAGIPAAVAPIPVSVAAALDRADGSVADRLPLAATFNSLASGATSLPPAVAVAPIVPAPSPMAVPGFDQSTGMI